jgi:uncharacterized protein (TIGR03435 family)
MASKQQPPPNGLQISGLHVDIGGATMKELIFWAYKFDARLVVGPKWVTEGETRFAIHAVMPIGSVEDQVPDMLKTLLAQRFSMTANQQMIEGTAYDLVLGKNGPKLKKPVEIKESACDHWQEMKDPTGTSKLCLTRTAGDKEITTRLLTDSAWGPTLWSESGFESHHEFYSMTMQKLAEYLASRLSRGGPTGWGGTLGPTMSAIPVVDRTGVEGSWYISLDTTDDNQDNVLSSLSGSLDKLGLHLQRSNAPINKLVIEHIDAVPADN